MIKSVVEFKVETIQILDHNSCFHGNYKVLEHDLLAIYENMVRTRLFDKKAIALQRTGNLGTFPSSYGQEAIYTVIGHLMNNNDVLCPYYRDQATFIQRGIKLEEILSYWGGDERGNAYENQSQDLPISVPIASQCLHAVGVGYAIKYKNEKKAVITTIGEGGTSKGDFYEAMNFAALYNLPVIFIINNNKWAISVPSEKQSATKTYAQKAISAGIGAVKVDGNDVFSLHYAIDNAIQKARNGDGPSVIEAETFRLCDHTTADDATRYIPKEQMDAAKGKEPLSRLKKHLENSGLWNEKKEESLLEKMAKEINEAVEIYLNTPPQKPTSILESLYDKLPEALQDQYNELEEMA
ncbi:MAG: pyruvate dehydrogenase (acetyl-transferring) E1 component subunit alpha [Legionellales bacterium]|jgi:2-oxoisovalerate dehydrogenase E1 component alpha subunit|nr:pyruvate dehydrogenase (acetyl-transferring) E1 component subunit alpha [Legionellales bacterium]